MVKSQNVAVGQYGRGPTQLVVAQVPPAKLKVLIQSFRCPWFPAMMKAAPEAIEQNEPMMADRRQHVNLEQWQLVPATGIEPVTP